MTLVASLENWRKRELMERGSDGEREVMERERGDGEGQ